MSRLKISSDLALPLEAVTETFAILAKREVGNPEDIMRRFWRYVEPEPMSGCWLWTGGQVRGYGYLSLGAPSRRKILAHRFSYLVFRGPLDDGELVCHRCDAPPCCNPAHLFTGRQLDNMRDATAKGRVRSRGLAGERCHLARLTESTVRSIRSRAAIGESFHVLAAEHGITYQGIAAIVTRRTWRHVA